MTSNAAAGGQTRGGGGRTPFGEAVLKIRQNRGILLIDMARVAEVSPGFLSLVETGKKPVPDTLVDKIAVGFDLTARQQEDLRDAAALSAQQYKIEIAENASALDRQVAHALQTGFAKMSPTTKTKILKLLKKD